MIDFKGHIFSFNIGTPKLWSLANLATHHSSIGSWIHREGRKKFLGRTESRYHGKGHRYLFVFQKLSKF